MSDAWLFWFSVSSLIKFVYRGNRQPFPATSSGKPSVHYLRSTKQQTDKVYHQLTNSVAHLAANESVLAGLIKGFCLMASFSNHITDTVWFVAQVSLAADSCRSKNKDVFSLFFSASNPRCLIDPGHWFIEVILLQNLVVNLTGTETRNNGVDKMSEFNQESLAASDKWGHQFSDWIWVTPQRNNKHNEKWHA